MPYSMQHLLTTYYRLSYIPGGEGGVLSYNSDRVVSDEIKPDLKCSPMALEGQY